MQSTRNQLIQLLAQSSERYISGQVLSDKLGVSRSAIWKHMQILETDGYVIEGRTNRGYRIVQYPDKVSEHTLQWGLNTDWIGKTIIHKKTTASTQFIAHQLAQEGATHGTIVVADEQTEGKGRMNRYWYSPKGKGISLSLILRPTILPYLAPQFTLLTATVLADVIHSHMKIEPQIKWPNDLLLHDKKVAGILTEMQAEQDQIQYVIIGMGINVNHEQHELPDELKNKATSIQVETGQLWSNRDIVQAILRSFERIYDQFVIDGFDPIKTHWEQYGYKLGEHIIVNNFKKKWQTIFVGISEDGALLTKEPNGEIKKIYSAEIQWYNEPK